MDEKDKKKYAFSKKEFVRNIARAFISLVGASIGVGLTAGINALVLELGGTQLFFANSVARLLIYVGSAVLFGLLFFFISPALLKRTNIFIGNAESMLNDIPLVDIIFGTIGLIVGLIIAYLMSSLVMMLPVPGINSAISVMLYLLFGVLGWKIARKRRGELRPPEAMLKRFTRDAKDKPAKPEKPSSKPKVLDTSVIIDGRIFDISKTGIIEGELIVPVFVLQELRHISDSADGLKRNRGRRGLDILNRMQKELEIPVRVEERDYDDIAEVDAKLIRLAQDLKGVVVTNDYNLNKVAVVHGVQVLNINELANAIKPVVLPGEEMMVTIVKDGKEQGQGVGYLDDGTMIVVDNGRSYMNETRAVLVTSVLQTAAGRMIFAKIK